ncbi:OprO/OprP family phosphate-selective porin [Luteolibacter flavescens]|uniref:OprO/OprP family phosphate-selective porin n=1 Tax=Luteolibacter flavescens TaxID=1859460 RepID=A0ABT3FKF8_9BACT|nr:OprO/OprP family phosphate-selective porin [Luteolibacter flavescens]MCW1884058.1 OprO/OprP family phosphate-selective porin [Luteolibacter flavescens]
MKAFPKLLLFSCLAGPLALPCTAQAAEPAAESAAKPDGGGKKKKKKKNKDKSNEATAPAADTSTASAKDAPDLAVPPPATNNGNWCEWLQNDPGLLYNDPKNRWIQSFEVGGRFHYQIASMEGTDVNGTDFNDTYDEYRRLRLETKTQFLKHFVAEVNVNLVNDRRFRDDFFNELEWGYDRFDEVSLEFDIGEAFGDGWLDGIKLKYGRMKLKMTEEVHMSSNEIYTIERSAIADKVGGDASRPTGVTLELDKGDWDLTLGMFSAEDDSDFIAGWGEGQFFYGSLEWRASKNLKLVLDYTQNNHDGNDDALGYGWASAFSAIYKKKHWGVIAEAIYGDNGGGISAPITRRQGDFHGFVVMPWYWIVEDKLQAVVQYQYASSPESQGLQLPVRYVRAEHENPMVDVDNGRGNEHHYLYAGLNWHLCRDRVKVMGGFSLDDLTTRRSEIKAYTWQLAVRTSF